MACPSNMEKIKKWTHTHTHTHTDKMKLTKIFMNLIMSVPDWLFLWHGVSIPCSDLLLSLQSFECLWSFEGICKKRTRHQKIIQRRETLLVNILYKEIYFKMCKNVFSPSHKKKVFKRYPGTETQTLENKAKIDLFSLYAFFTRFRS